MDQLASKTIEARGLATLLPLTASSIACETACRAPTLAMGAARRILLP